MSSKDPQLQARKRALFRLIDSYERKNIDLALQLIRSDRNLFQATKQRYYPLLRLLDPQLGQGLQLLYRISDEIQWNQSRWKSRYTAHYADLQDWEMVQWAIDRFPHSVREVYSVNLLSYLLSREWPDRADVRDVLVSHDKTHLIVPDPAPGIVGFRSMSRLEVGSGQQLEALLPILPEDSDLDQLAANRCALRDLPEAAGRLLKLDWLELTQNQLEEVPGAIRSMKSLKRLILRDNQLRQVPEWLSQLRNLSWLVLAGNAIKALPPGFLAKSKVKKLDLQRNQVTDLGLAEGEQNEHLEELDLTMNPLGRFPLELQALKSLKKLSLRNCGLTSLPPRFVNFQGLEQLDITDNPMTSSPSKKLNRLRNSLGFKLIY